MTYCKQSHNRLLSPLICSPSTPIQRGLYPFHCSMECCISSIVALLNDCAALVPTSFTDWKCFSFNALSTSRNREKSQGARSGKYRVCSSTACSLKTALKKGYWRLVRCPGAESISSFGLFAFSEMCEFSVHQVIREKLYFITTNDICEQVCFFCGPFQCSSGDPFILE